MKHVFLIFTIFTCIYGCSTETDNGKSEPLFTAPVEIDQPKTEDDPSVFTPIQPIFEPEPEDVKVPDRVFDIFAPKLVESNVFDGDRNVDIHLNDITLTFDEDIAKSNVQIFRDGKTSLRWKRIINGKNVLLTPLGNVIDLRADQQYQISGIVEDAAGNARAILITFTTEKRDKTSPVFLRTTISHGDFGVNLNTDSFTFGFNEDIGDVRISIKNKNTGRDLRWTHVIRGKEIILHKLDKGLSLQGGVTYRISIAWADESGNWDQGGIIDFTTEIKE